MTIVWSMDNLPSTQTLVLLALADNASDQGKCFPSVSTLVKKTRLSERAVQKCITDLENDGHLTRFERHGRSTVYDIHPRTTCTPECGAPPHVVHPTPARGAPHPRTSCTHNHHVTVKEPSFVPDSAKPIRDNDEKKVSRKRRTGLTEQELPEIWQTYLLDRVPDADPEEMFCNFRDHHLKLGSTMADWGAAWRTWVQNVTKGMPYVRRSTVQSVSQAKPQLTAAAWIKFQEERRARIAAETEG